MPHYAAKAHQSSQYLFAVYLRIGRVGDEACLGPGGEGDDFTTAEIAMSGMTIE
jgi:hypothetical protein